MQMCSLNKVQMEKGAARKKKKAGEIIMSRGAFMFSKALKIILSACLDKITGWFRLFQSKREIKAAFIYFYLFLFWAGWAVSVGSSSWCWAGWMQVGAAVWGLLRNCAHQFLFSSK